MATTIDALVVTLGLDPAKFTQGQRAAVASFKKTQEEATTVAKNVEAQGKRAGEFFSQLRNQALGLIGLLVGGMGLKAMVSHITTTDAALGRFSRNVGVNATTIAAWQAVATRFGGSAEGMSTSFTALSDAFAGWKIGIVSPMIADLMAVGVAGGKLLDTNKSVQESLFDLADNLKNIHEQDPARAGLLGRRLGLDPALFDLLIRGREEVQKMLALVKQTGVATKENTDAAGALQMAWNDSLQAIINVGRAIQTDMTPQLITVLGWTRDIAMWIGKWLPNTIETKQGKLSLWAVKLAEWLGKPFDISAASGVGTSGAGTQPLRTKAGATGGGGASLGTMALAHALQAQIPELKEFTAINDKYHALIGGQHPKGLALDFTLTDPSKSAAIAEAVRARLAAMGIDAKVIDEYKYPSKGSTGGHIHVGFANAEAAARYQDATGATGGAAFSQVTNANSRVSSSHSEMNINGPITVTTQATDAEGIARDFRAALMRRQSLAAHANTSD